MGKIVCEKKRQLNNHGFSLLELLVVMAIIVFAPTRQTDPSLSRGKQSGGGTEKQTGPHHDDGAGWYLT